MQPRNSIRFTTGNLLIIVRARVVAVEFRTKTFQTKSLPMISFCRVLSAFTALCFLVLTLHSATAQKAAELAVDESLKSTPTANLFETPVRLTVNDLPLNADKQVMNIAPTLHDVDGDGKLELISGGVSGELGVHRKENASQDGDSAFKDDLAWGPRQVFEDTSGAAITLTNW